MKLFLPTFLMALCLSAGAQPKNLVLNPGFELLKPGKTHPACAYGSTSAAFNIAMSAWNTFPDCTPDLVVWKPLGAADCFSKPHGGVHAVGLITFLPGEDMGRTWDFHEFVQGKLSAPLTPGKEYTFECYIQQADSVSVRHLRQLYHMLKTLEVMPLASGNFGVFFSLSQEKERRLDVAFPQLLWQEPVLTQQGEWICLRKTFTADKPYLFFTIGNFALDENTAVSLENNEEIRQHNLQFKDWRHKKKRVGYYLLDDVAVWDGTPPPATDIATELKTKKAYTFQNLNFETGKWDLLPESLPELKGLLDFLKENPSLSVEIAGHTDNVGSGEANRSLSRKRAEAVANYLVSKGVQKERASFEGYGEDAPLAPNDSEEGRRKNRRVECKIR